MASLRVAAHFFKTCSMRRIVKELAQALRAIAIRVSARGNTCKYEYEANVTSCLVLSPLAVAFGGTQNTYPRLSYILPLTAQ